ncbi:VCBS repeat-containing protein [Actinoplanes sp. TRM 88003]|uniref:VCBS repeat-containing protein n=1 Tax=Paractinoplanes aksuensis TaxID=2939490 RepID=A0ABT1E317_9ACTN|nr:VCBS repeat-containing protein [Actinoplanes aksuensis]MCO8277493.1 VCBS repeat-containing protein [Actinoplanes aksuensis]
MRLARPSSVIMTVALGVGVLMAPGSAGSAALARASAVIPSAPCQPDGVSAADDTVARQLRPVLNGRRLGDSVSGYSISCARAIIASVRARGLNERAAVISVTGAIAESSLRNYTVAVDHDSLGLFQQRPSQGWGQQGQLTDPRFATHAFLNKMLRKHPAGSWQSGDVGQICQRVQGSALPLAYAPEEHDARLVVAALWPRALPPALPPVEKPAEKPTEKPKPSGPFHRSLMSTTTSQGLADARHDFIVADWNADRRPDLIVVERSTAAGAPAKLTILDGKPTLPGTTASFQRLLLTTIIPLGPAGERSTFSMTDWNGDGQLDLAALQNSGTASGRAELRVLDGASFYQRDILATATSLAAGDDRRTFSATDWNNDGRLDLAVVQKSDANGAEMRILDGASNFAQDLQPPATVPGPVDDRHDLTITDWNGDGKVDLVAIQKTGTTSKRTEVRVLDGASNFTRDRQRTVTALGPTDDRRHVTVSDWNGDAKLDLVVIQKTGTTSGRTEANILAG